MQHTLLFNSHFQNPLSNFKNLHTHEFPSILPLSQSQSISNQTHLRKLVICARKKKRTSGHKQILTLLPQLLSFLASNPNILPAPLGLAIAELGGESGGGLGFLKGFKWGNNDGWKRMKKVKLGVFGVMVITSVLLLYGRELKSERVAVVGFLVLGCFVALLARKHERKIRDFVLGICFGIALVGLSMRREEMQKCVQRITVSSPVLKLLKKTRRRNGRRHF